MLRLLRSTVRMNLISVKLTNLEIKLHHRFLMANLNLTLGLLDLVFEYIGKNQYI